MKPVVSSLVALALAIAPMSAFAAKPVHGKTALVSHEKASHDKDAKKDEKSVKAEKSAEKTDAIVRVKAGKKDGAAAKIHHASNVNLEGAGHKEPKDGLVAASMTTKIEKHEKSEKIEKSEKSDKHAVKKTASKDLPKLPDPKAGKPSKGGAEKGARKASEKKNEKSESSSDDGEPSRDEVTAELVARVRGQKNADEQATEERAESVSKVAHSHVDESGNFDESMTKAKAEAAEAAREAKEEKKGAHGSAKPCSKEPVEIVRGPEVERFALTKCDGTIAPLAIEHLSVLVRPGGAARPTAPYNELAKRPGQELAHGIRRVDGRLVERIQALAEHFGKPGAPAKLAIISGYRPASVGSMHATGRAIDFRLEGVKNEDVVAFCKTLSDTGCGYYPNSSFVHVDVRDAGAGHVSWIDASGPGETPRYVSTWPESGASAAKKGLERTSAVTSDKLVEEGESILRAHRPAEVSDEQ